MITEQPNKDITDHIIAAVDRFVAGLQQTVRDLDEVHNKLVEKLGFGACLITIPATMLVMSGVIFCLAWLANCLYVFLT